MRRLVLHRLRRWNGKKNIKITSVAYCSDGSNGSFFLPVPEGCYFNLLPKVPDTFYLPSLQEGVPLCMQKIICYVFVQKDRFLSLLTTRNAIGKPMHFFGKSELLPF